MPARLFFENQYLAKTRLLRVRYLHFRWLATFTFLCYVPEKKGGPPTQQRHNAPALSCTSEIAAHLRIYTLLRASNTMSCIQKTCIVFVPPSIRAGNFKSLKGSLTIPHSVHLPCWTIFFGPRLHKNMAVEEWEKKGASLAPFFVCLGGVGVGWLVRRWVSACVYVGG